MGLKVLITKQYLTDIAAAIRAKLGVSTSYRPADMAAAIASIPAGASNIELLYSTTVNANTTSTSNQTVATISPGMAARTGNKLIWVTIRDTAGPRGGRFYGSDTFFANYQAKNGNTSTLTVGVSLITRYATSGAFTTAAYSSSAAYGVFAYSIASNGNIVIRSRYNNNNSTTINGTYEVKVYAVTYPGTTSFGQ